MLQNKQINKNVVVFSQWRRKSYAIFASLKKVVNIAHLSIDISNSSLLKNPAVIRLLNLFNIEVNENNDCDISELLDNSPLLLSALPIISTNNDIYGKQKLISINSSNPIFCIMQSMGLLF